MFIHVLIIKRWKFWFIIIYLFFKFIFFLSQKLAHFCLAEIKISLTAQFKILIIVN